MTITIFRSDCYLFRGDWVAMYWPQWSFDPISGSERETETGFRKLRDVPLPFTVKLPPLAKREGDRIFPSGDKWGVDADSVASLASRKERGFEFITESDQVKQRSLFDDAPAPPETNVARVCSEIRAQAVVERDADLDSEADRLRELIRRAIEQLDKSQPMTARAILQGAEKN